MTLKIGVDAQTQGAKKGLSDVETSTKNVSKAVDGVGQSARKTTQDLNRMEQALKRVEYTAKQLENIRKILGREFGTNVSPEQTRSFLDQFERMRSDKHFVGGRRLRQYSDFESWYQGNDSSFLKQQDAARYRRHVMAAAGGGIGGMPGGPGAGPAGGGGFQGAVSSGWKMTRAFAGGMLALSGITSIMSMLGRAVDLGNEESIGSDTLKRNLGDVNKGFYDLRNSLRAAVDGLGATSVEAVRLAQHFAKQSSGTNDPAGEVRNALGFARAYGIEGMESTTFFGRMRNYKATSEDDRGSRRLALLIAEAIEKGGMTSKADQVLEAVSNFTAQAATFALTRSDGIGFAGAMSNLVSRGIPGLDPATAASMLGTADQSLRHGGGVGEASKNFLYGAATRAYGRMDPVQAMALFESGLFGTASGTFGKNSALGQYYGGGPQGNQTNLELVMKSLRRDYGGNQSIMLDAVKNLFGMQSYGQAAAFMQLENGGALGSTTKLLESLGLDPSKISATGVAQFARVATADRGGLQKELDSLMGRSDITDDEKRRMSGWAREGKVEELRKEMGRVVALHDQESTDGTLIRKSISDLQQSLTNIGAPLASNIALIKDGIMAMVTAVAPKSDVARRFAAEEADRKSRIEQMSRLDDFRKRLDSASPSDRDQLIKDNPALYDALMSLKGGTSEKKQKFLEQYGPAAIKAGQRLGVDPSILLGQAALESDWGNKVVGAHNVFNLKPSEDERRRLRGRFLHGRDNMTGSNDPYLSFGSPEEAFASMEGRLMRMFPGSLRSGTDRAKYLRGLLPGQRGGFAEDPDYANKVFDTSLSVENTLMPGGKKFGDYVREMQMRGEVTGQITIIDAASGKASTGQASFGMNTTVAPPAAAGGR